MTNAKHAALDAAGRPKTKMCEICKTRAQRTARNCTYCGTEFLSRNKAWRRLRQARLDGQLDGATMPALLPPEPKRVLAVAVQGLYEIPLDADFICKPTPSGGMLIFWPKHNIRVTLTKGERTKFRVADHLS